MRLIALLAILAIGGCNKQVGGENDRVCTTPMPMPTVASVSSAEQSDATDRCVHVWAYRLARAPGGNAEITDAVMGACKGAAEHFSVLKAREYKIRAEFEADAAEFREKALFRVVQARAGKCDIP